MNPVTDGFFGDADLGGDLDVALFAVSNQLRRQLILRGPAPFRAADSRPVPVVPRRDCFFCWLALKTLNLRTASVRVDRRVLV